MQVMRLASWDAVAGSWALAPPPDVSALDFGAETDDDDASGVSYAASSPAVHGLLARPPWDLQSASSLSSWQVRSIVLQFPHEACGA